MPNLAPLAAEVPAQLEAYAAWVLDAGGILERAADDRFHTLAADAPTTSRAEVECLCRRVAQLETIARLIGEAIRGMQQGCTGVSCCAVPQTGSLPDL